MFVSNYGQVNLNHDLVHQLNNLYLFWFLVFPQVNCIIVFFKTNNIIGVDKYISTAYKHALLHLIYVICIIKHHIRKILFFNDQITMGSKTKFKNVLVGFKINYLKLKVNLLNKYK